MHWPAKIKEGSAFRTEPTHLIDIMATCVDVGGGDYPTTYNNQPIQQLEGKSLMLAFANQDLQREAIYWDMKAIGQFGWVNGN